MEFKPVLVTNKQLLNSVEVNNGQFLVINDTQELYVDYDGGRVGISSFAHDLPAASAALEGRIFQYTGETTGNLTNGYFYKCVNNNGVYSWQKINVQAGHASDISYNNTSSQLSATQVQGAIDEVNTKVNAWHSFLTSTQYNNLTAAQKNNGTLYFVFDSGDPMGKIYRNSQLYSGIPESTNITYDNTTSELTATDIQAAIDELVVRIKALEQS